MKLTFKNKRADANGRHNDRNFDVSKSDHIDRERSDGNRYYTYNGNHDDTFRDVELGFYRERFAKYVDAQNLRNAENRHKGRHKTIEQYYTGRYTRPEDLVIQVGGVKDGSIPPEKLWDACEEYRRRFDEKYGERCKILTMALHADEATPHVHVRRVWISDDRNGLERVNQGKALESLGFDRPDMTKPEDMKNNAKQAFTASDRQMFRDICKEKGIELEEDRHSGKVNEMTDKEKMLERAEIRDEIERQIAVLQNELNEKTEELKGMEEAPDNMLRIMEGMFPDAGSFDEMNERFRKMKMREKIETLRKMQELAETSGVNPEGLTKDRMNLAVTKKELEKRKAFMKHEGIEEKYQALSKERRR